MKSLNEGGILTQSEVHCNAETCYRLCGQHDSCRRADSWPPNGPSFALADRFVLCTVGFHHESPETIKQQQKTIRSSILFLFLRLIQLPSARDAVRQ